MTNLDFTSYTDSHLKDIIKDKGQSIYNKIGAELELINRKGV